MPLLSPEHHVFRAHDGLRPVMGSPHIALFRVGERTFSAHRAMGPLDQHLDRWVIAGTPASQPAVRSRQALTDRLDRPEPGLPESASHHAPRTPVNRH